MVTSQLNASKTRKGGATKVGQWIWLVVKKLQSNDMNAAEANKFEQFKAYCENQGRDGYNSPWDTKLNNVKLGFKNIQVKFSNEV